MLSPGWKYNLNVVKFINGTDKFMALEDSVKGCQIQPFDSCTTLSYVERLVQECSCLPLSMRVEGHEKIPLCMPKQLKCAKEVELIDKNCKKSCEGLYVTSYFKSQMNEDSFADFWSKVRYDYMKYKIRKDVDFPKELRGSY